MTQCLFALTGSQYRHYPAYVNISRHDDGGCEISVRSEEAQHAGYMRLNAEQFQALVAALGRMS